MLTYKVGGNNMQIYPIFHLKRIERAGYDETQSMVVIARDEAEARKIASSTRLRSEEDDVHENGFGDEGGAVWGNPESVICEQIGVTNDAFQARTRIVCTAFRSA